MPKFNHTYTVAFSLISETSDGSDVTPLMMRTALLKRIQDLDQACEWEEALGTPFDTYGEE